MFSTIFNSVKRIIPRISETELLALRSGTTCIDREIFKGNVSISSKLTDNTFEITNKFIEFDKKADDLHKKYGETKVYPNPNHTEILDYLGKNKFRILRRLTKKPVIALGGFSKENIRKLKLLCCDGFSGISYFK